MKILLTNDDGIFAPGLAAIQKELNTLGDVDVVAPQHEQSAMGHSITFEGPLSCDRLHVNEEFHGYGVDGRPADCVKLAVLELLDGKPDLIVSGINTGENVGIHVLYSGTVAAAIEGAFFDVPSIAVSLEYGREMDFVFAARTARWVIEALLQNGLKAGYVYNVNIPTADKGSPKGVRATRLTPYASFNERYESRTDPHGRRFFWLTGEKVEQDDGLESDLTALRSGYVSITPLHFDMTHLESLEETRGWTFPPPPPERDVSEL
jgi:5'-nucleotidase